MGSNSGLLFLGAVVLVSMMLFALALGTVCLFIAQGPNPPSSYVKSTTTYWVYGSISFAIGVVMLLVLLYLAYAWSCMCSSAQPVTGRRGRSSSACARPVPACAY